MAPALSLPSDWEVSEAFSGSIPIVTTTPVPGLSFGSSGAAASDSVTIDRPDSTKHSLQSIKDTSAVAPSHIIIDPTPVASDLHVTLVLAPTVELADILELLEQQGVSIPTVTAAIFISEGAENGLEGVVEDPELKALPCEVPTTGWVKVATVSVKIAGFPSTGLICCARARKTFLIVRVKIPVLGHLVDTVGRTIFWATQQVQHVSRTISQTRAERRGGLLGRRPLPFERRAVY
jgi:hypothetical protein